MTQDAFLAAILRNPNNAAIVERLPELGLNDCWLVSGALFQTVWNLQSGLPPTHGIKDYDIFYFDADISWGAEDAAIARTRTVFADLGVAIEVRNQARVHLWYEKKFARPYPPLQKATDGIDRFLSRNAQVGVRPTGASWEIYAPQGLADIAAMIVRPNRTANYREDLFQEKARRWQSVWPRVTIAPEAA